MYLSRILPGAAVALILTATALVAPSRADDITPSHLAAAVDAVRDARASKGFDNVLPVISERVQDQIIRLRPDLYKQIAGVVQQEALKLVGRRAELDNAVAQIWAKTFTEDELKAISAFYKSPAGAKFVDALPQVIGDSAHQVQVWSDKVGQELMDKSRESLKKQGVEF
jgi:hypothetical protein